jgi:putative salt-induced outer membrane protein YdiY
MLKRIILLTLIVSLAFADQVTMRNGDRLSGSVVKYDGKNLILNSQFAGVVTIPWDAVTAVNSTDPLNVGLKDGQVMVGTVTTLPEGGIQVATRDAGTVSTTKDKIDFVRSKDEQAVYQAQIDRYTNPRIVDLWVGTLDLGYSLARGNAETENFTLNANANRATSRDKISVYYTQIFASSETAGVNATTANAKRGGIAYSLNFTPRWFVFGSVDLEQDQFQNLDLRFAPAGGIGYHIIETERTQFDAVLGGSLNREFFTSGRNRTSGEILVGEELTHKFNSVTSLHERLAFFPNLSSTGNYRMNFDMTVATAIRKWFSWQFTASDRYLTNPDPGRKKNDILFATGLRLNFAR